jgi:hypothetical protein
MPISKISLGDAAVRETEAVDFGGNMGRRKSNADRIMDDR